MLYVFGEIEANIKFVMKIMLNYIIIQINIFFEIHEFNCKRA